MYCAIQKSMRNVKHVLYWERIIFYQERNHRKEPKVPRTPCNIWFSTAVTAETRISSSNCWFFTSVMNSNSFPAMVHINRDNTICIRMIIKVCTKKERNWLPIKAVELAVSNLTKPLVKSWDCWLREQHQALPHFLYYNHWSFRKSTNLGIRKKKCFLLPLRDFSLGIYLVNGSVPWELENELVSPAPGIYLLPPNEKILMALLLPSQLGFMHICL